MSHGPSTFGTMITSSRSPMAPTSVVRSSRHQGLSRLLIRVHSGVSPRSTSRAIRTRPSRAASFLSAGIASSRLPSRMSASRASSGSFAAILGLLGSKKWITREGLTGISRSGAGAPRASGLKKSRGLRMAGLFVHQRARRRELARVELDHLDAARRRRLHAEVAERALVEVLLDDAQRAVGREREDVHRTDLDQLARECGFLGHR